MKPITIKDNEAFLRQVSYEVDIKSDSSLKKDISILDEFCTGSTVMAMAAVQLGIPKRLIYLKNTNLNIINSMNDEDIKDYNEARVLINPTIIKKEGLTEYWEACASCLDNCGLVLRPYKITLEYYDLLENKHIDVFEGFPATVLSHEMDHLDGILHIDKAIKILQMSAKERKIFRQTHNYKIYFKNGDYDALKSKF